MVTKKQQKVTEGNGPSLRARWLGKLLKEYRARNGSTLDKVGEFLEHNGSTISRIESAEYPIRRADLMVLLDFYQITSKHEREALLALREDAWKQGWWDGYEEAFYDQKFVDYPWLESRAVSIGSYESQILSGLMQTPAYAEAMMRCAEGPDVSKSQLANGLEARLARQGMLNREDAPTYTALVDEAALRRPVGGRDVMRAQLAHLLEIAEHPNVGLRVVPFDACEHPSMLGGFTLFEMPEPYPGVAYVESMAGRMFVEDAARLGRIRRAFAELQESAASKAESIAMISAIAEET